MKKFDLHSIEKRFLRICLSSRIFRKVYSGAMWILTNRQDHIIGYNNQLAYINKFRPFKSNVSCYTKRKFDIHNANDLDIIIPVYNVSAYIVDCLNSILKQKTKYKIKIILIEDGSTDGSDQLIKQYENDPRVKIIYQSNQGVSAARNRGLDYLDSAYVMFVDADDLLNDLALNKLLDKAFEMDADIVEGGYFEFSEDNILRNFNQQDNKNANFTSLNGYPWGKVIKSEYFSNLQFPVGYLFEDTIFIFILYRIVSKIVTINDVVYKYRINELGLNISSKNNYSRIDSLWITKLIIRDLPFFGIKKTQELYEVLLNQILINGRRIFRLKPLELQRAVFEVTAEKIRNNWQGIPVNPEFKQLEKALKTNNFYIYLLCCLSK
ncbi:glycosyltransferase family 2 protein [Ligilactobacillus acidipiscis]|uniref:glycosyltransferase family 2 protein n=1 Tax=Ligilactobacillus acidipiscis TaxID=89059 RepID=UPI0022E587C9|nr:glycosyltransferase [Ligilactobacillus acidipiscis]